MSKLFAGVDDSKTIRFIFKKAAEKLGCELIQGEDGQDGFDNIIKAIDEGKEIGLIISDMNMPNVNGIEFVKMLKADDRTRDIPVVFLTSEESHEIEVQSRIVGAEGWLSKPLDADKVAGLVSRFLG